MKKTKNGRTSFTFDKDVLSKSRNDNFVDAKGIVRDGLVYLIYRNKEDNPVKIIGFPAEWVMFIKEKDDDFRYLLVCNDKPFVALTDRMIVQADRNLEDFGVPVDFLRTGHLTVGEYEREILRLKSLIGDNN